MKKFLSGFVSLIILLALVVPVVADDGQIGDLQKQIEELTRKIETAQSQERTLNAEIKAMDQKIKLTTLQIAETAEKIKQLGKEILELNRKIERLDETLTKLSELLINRMVTSYKISRVSYLTLIISGNGITDFINRTKYIQLAQKHDQQVMTEVQLAKTNFSEQKELREQKKQQQEALRKQLETQQTQLNQQKKTKVTLLEQTKNDEVTYQRLLQQAMAEKEAIEAALINGEKVGPVKTGEPIALVGNTGYPACSTGAHLHFEVRKDNQWNDPGNYLQSKTVADQQDGGNTTIGHGNWNWPLEGDIIITQHFGHTPYSWRYTYSGGNHTGLDMFSFTSSVIRAPKDGTLYSASQNCGGSSIIKIKYIDHGDGLMSFYLHVQ